MIHPHPRDVPNRRWFAILDTQPPSRKKKPYPNPQQLAILAQNATLRCCFTGHTTFTDAQICGLSAFTKDSHLWFGQVEINPS
jgi:hypothetical protein